MNLGGHSIALRLRCGCAAYMTCASCGDHVRLPRVGCDAGRMLCLLLQRYIRDTSAALAEWTIFFCSLPLEFRSIRFLHITGILACEMGLVWLKGRATV